MSINPKKDLKRMSAKGVKWATILGGCAFLIQSIFMYFVFIDIQLSPIKDEIPNSLYVYLVGRFRALFWAMSIWGIFFVCFSWLAYMCMKKSKQLLYNIDEY